MALDRRRHAINDAGEWVTVWGGFVVLSLPSKSGCTGGAASAGYRHPPAGRYNLPALEQTTGELRTAFRKSTVPMRDVAGFMSIFSESDLVKFARYQPQLDDVYSLVNRARTAVDATTPAPEVAGSVESVRPEPEAAV